MRRLREALKAIGKGNNFFDKIIIFLSYFKISYNVLIKKQYSYWVKLIRPIRLKGPDRKIIYFAELLTYSEVHENNKFLKVFNNKKYKFLLDIGGHTGRLTYTFLTQDKTRRAIYIEPNPNSYKIFSDFIKDKKLKERVKCFNIGISNKEGEKSFYLSSKFGGCSSIEKPKDYYEKIKIKTSTLDELNKDMDLSEIDLIKIDVEGHETKAIQGMKKYLKENNITMIIELNDDKAKKRLFQELDSQKINYNAKKLDSYNYIINIKK